jgi:hypothetical protein
MPPPKRMNNTNYQVIFSAVIPNKNTIVDNFMYQVVDYTPITTPMHIDEWLNNTRINPYLQLDKVPNK